MTPDDELAFVGEPPLLRPEADEVHISVTFSWDRPEAERLAEAWSAFYPDVKIGGPAYKDPGGEFLFGMYLKTGVTITSRGCPNHCPFCYVPVREGPLRCLPISLGHIVQDNNLLACPWDHICCVFDMLREQKRAAVFSGGIEAQRVGPAFAELLKTIRVKGVWLAYDQPEQLRYLRRACELLSFLPRRKLRCYVLIGFGKDTIEKAQQRLQEAWDAGTLPFAMLYVSKKGHTTSDEWRRFQRTWTRPAAMFSEMESRFLRDEQIKFAEVG